MSDRKRWTLGFVFTSGLEHVVMLKKARSLHVGLWNGLGGTIENDESPLHSMIRECKEESGISTVKEDWVRVGKIVGDNGSYRSYAQTEENWDWIVHVFAYRGKDNRSGHPEYANIAAIDSIARDKAVYIPLPIISTMKLAPLTGALIHISLDKLKNPEISDVLLKILSERKQV